MFHLCGPCSIITICNTCFDLMFHFSRAKLRYPNVELGLGQEYSCRHPTVVWNLLPSILQQCRSVEYFGQAACSSRGFQFGYIYMCCHEIRSKRLDGFPIWFSWYFLRLYHLPGRWCFHHVTDPHWPPIGAWNHEPGNGCTSYRCPRIYGTQIQGTSMFGRQIHHFIFFHIISYHFIYNFISFHIISYYFISFHIVSCQCPWH